MKKKKKHKKKALSGSYQKKLRFYQNCLRKYPTIAEIRFRYALCKYFNIEFEFDWPKAEAISGDSSDKKTKKRPFVNLSRSQELKMQEEFIKKNGVTKLVCKRG